MKKIWIAVVIVIMGGAFLLVNKYADQPNCVDVAESEARYQEFHHDLETRIAWGLSHKGELHCQVQIFKFGKWTFVGPESLKEVWGYYEDVEELRRRWDQEENTLNRKLGKGQTEK